MKRFILNVFLMAKMLQYKTEEKFECTECKKKFSNPLPFRYNIRIVCFSCFRRLKDREKQVIFHYAITKNLFPPHHPLPSPIILGL